METLPTQSAVAVSKLTFVFILNSVNCIGPCIQLQYIDNSYVLAPCSRVLHYGTAASVYLPSI